MGAALPGLLMLGGGLLSGIGSFFGGKSKANQEDKYNREQAAATLPYRTRQGAARTGASNLSRAIMRAYGIEGALGGSDVLGPLGQVTPTPYTPNFVEHPSALATGLGAAGGVASGIGQGMQQRESFDEFMQRLNGSGGVGGPPTSATPFSSPPLSTTPDLSGIFGRR